MRPEISAGAVIFRRYKKRREYLLLHYEAGHWDFAKGHLENTEVAQEAARREIFEETGLRHLKFYPAFRKDIRYWMWSYRNRKSNQKKPVRAMKIVTFFLAESLHPVVRLSHEHTGFVWLPFHDAVKLATYKNAKDLIRAAEEYLLRR